MHGSALALDQILSVTSFFVGKWTPGFKRNQARDVLRFLVCRLYDQDQGNLMRAQMTLAQSTLARKVGLSRQWVGILLGRLQDAGWIDCYAPPLEDGMRGSTVFRVGRQLKRLLLMLAKTKPRKRPRNSAANNRWQFSPSPKEKRQEQILEREKVPPNPQLLVKIPLLKTWLIRG